MAVVTDWFNTIAASRALTTENASILQERGFVVIPGPVASVGLDESGDAESEPARRVRRSILPDHIRPSGV